jgi:endonuclease/exonuclease/phosphatase family metal-dependent hydrolase
MAKKAMKKDFFPITHSQLSVQTMMKMLALLVLLAFMAGCVSNPPQTPPAQTVPNASGAQENHSSTSNGSLSNETQALQNESTGETAENITQPTQENQSAGLNASAGNETVPGQQVPLTINQSSNITVASFNIQIFGESKRSKPGVMSVLTSIARRFDVMAIEELRDDTETTLPLYLSQINSLPGPVYNATMSPRLGRTVSKENYAFIYDTATVRLLGSYTFVDPPAGSSIDIFQREPFVARFNTTNGFDFVLIVLHNEPDTTPQELAALPLVLDDARKHFPDETDFIMLGDMNADCTYLSTAEESALALHNASFTWVVPDTADTTTKSTDCAYDRMILAGNASSHFTGQWGILRFDQLYGLNQSATEAVSDHYPIWAVFGSG